MPKSAAHYLSDLLAPWGAVDIRRMFGGLGAWRDGVFFALIIDDIIYFKVDDVNRRDYSASEPFSYAVRGAKLKVIDTLWRVPDEVLEDGETLGAWAQKSWEAAKRKRLAKPAHKKPGSAFDNSSLGPKSQKMLADVGIADAAQLDAVGAIETYRRLKAKFPKVVSLNMLWGLYAAVNRIPVADLTPDMKEQLQALLTEV
jgi:DNA transformation protein